MKEKVAAELKQNFRPEFLNRIDATVVFRSLTVEEITEIVDLMLERVRDQLRAQQMQLEVTQAAKEHIIKLGYDVAYGARPLRRVIQNMVEDVLAEHLLLGKYEPGTTIVVDRDPDAGLEIHAAEPRDARRGALAARWLGPRAGTSASRVVTRSFAGRASAGRAAPGTASSRRSSVSRRAPPGAGSVGPTGGAVRAAPLAEIGDPDVPRLTVGIGELDRVLGGGLVPGSLILLGGEPGIGKSTLLLQAAAGLVRGADPDVHVLYATGEESAAQVRLRAGRLGLLDGPAASRVSILAEHDIGQIVEAATSARDRSP